MGNIYGIIKFIVVAWIGITILSFFNSELAGTILLVGAVITIAIIGYYIIKGLGKLGNLFNLDVEVDDKDLAEFAQIMEEKFGLELEDINEEKKELVFYGVNEEESEKYNAGDFRKKNRDYYSFKENIEKELKKISLNNHYDFKIIKNEYNKNKGIVNFKVKYIEKSVKEVKNADDKFRFLSEKIGIKGSDGVRSLLVGFEEDKENDIVKMKFSYVDGINNIKQWNSKLEEIKDILGFTFTLDDNKNERVIEIVKVPKLKTALEFYKDGFEWENFLEKGKIFEGMTTKGAYYRNLSGLTHTGVAGQSGSGKSVQLHLTLKSVFYNIEQFERIYLGDLKGGLELSFLEDLGSDKLSFFGEAHEVLPIILNCELEMDARMAYMKANRIRNIVGNIILFIVDEYKQLNDLQMGKSGVSREVGNLIVQKIDRISALGRAMNVKLFLQSQNFTTDSIESSTRNNIQSLILMKTKNPEIQNACIPYSMREEMPNPADFTTGEKILLDSESGQTTHIQALFTEPNEEVSIDNSKKAYEMGLKNQEEIENIEEKVLPFKIKALERHIANADNLNEEVLEWYQNEYERLTGNTVEEIEEAEVITKPKKAKLNLDKEKQEKQENFKEELEEDLMGELDDILSSLKTKVKEEE